MKKFSAACLVVLSLISAAPAGADGAGIEGMLTRIEDGFYTVKDDAGKEHRLPYDAKVRKRGGEIKEGIKVELYVHDGKVSMIEIVK